jgi:phosphotransferase system HPr (HPr) family protein
MPSITLTVRNAAGLHARPAAMFVKTAKEFPCSITLRNITNAKPAANAKSPLAILTQAVQHGHQILIEAEGENADKALAALQQLVDSDFGDGAGHA